MLRELIIKNYAIIDHIHLTWGKGLNIVTGETGAGKSIIVGALGLAMGKRADTNLLKKNKDKCIVEAVFKLITHNNIIKDYFQANDLDLDEDAIILRREISVSGKSRSFVNDTPVMLNDLKRIASLLIDQHQQFDNFQIGNKSFQAEIIDTLATTGDLLEKYKQEFKILSEKKHSLQKLEQDKRDYNREIDYIEFQYKELDEANLTENELENIERDLKVMENAGDIKSALLNIYAGIYEDENSIINLLKKIASPLANYRNLNTLNSIFDRLQSVEIELKDIALETDGLNSDFSFDNERLEYLNERMSIGYKLLKKHNVNTTQELLTIQDGLRQKLEVGFNIDLELEALQTDVHKYEEQCGLLAKEISIKRKQQAPIIERNINDLLHKIGMPNASTKILVNNAEKLTQQGIDEIEILFDANKTGIYDSIEKVASGGELSRLMLCIKSLIAKFISLPTLIFDEIDTGISGEAARQVGIIMKELSDYIQVISITHQPQIASMATAHYFVFKSENSAGEITTRIKKLSKEERISQIAEMLSGSNPSMSSIKAAKEMIQEFV